MGTETFGPPTINCKLFLIKIIKTPHGDGNESKFCNYFRAFSQIKIIKTPHGDGNLNNSLTISTIFFIKIIKTPHGDGNSVSVMVTQCLSVLKSLKPRMGTETADNFNFFFRS